MLSRDDIRRALLALAVELAGTPVRCEIVVELAPRTVGAEDTDVDLVAAVDNATARLRRSGARALEHERAWHADQLRLLPPDVLPRRGR